MGALNSLHSKSLCISVLSRTGLPSDAGPYEPHNLLQQPEIALKSISGARGEILDFWPDTSAVGVTCSAGQDWFLGPLGWGEGSIKTWVSSSCIASTTVPGEGRWSPSCGRFSPSSVLTDGRSWGQGRDRNFRVSSSAP